MRRKDREITDFNTILSIIDECDIIRIGLNDGNCPYIVPVNFAYEIDNEKIFFYIHGAKAGKKYDILTSNPLCSFEMDVPIKLEVLPELKNATMRYKSVMGKCKVQLLEGEEKMNAFDNVFMSRHKETKGFEYNNASYENMAVFKLEVIELSAKANI